MIGIVEGKFFVSIFVIDQQATMPHDAGGKASAGAM